MLTKEHGFVSNMCLRIRQMTIQSFGGTIILDRRLPEQKTDRERERERLIDELTRGGFPLEGVDLAQLFNKDLTNLPRDLLVTIDMAHEEGFAPHVSGMGPLVESRSSHAELPAALEGLEARFFSAYCDSITTNALIIVVSEERRTISLFQRGVMQLDILPDAFERRLRIESGVSYGHW